MMRESEKLAAFVSQSSQISRLMICRRKPQVSSATS